MIEIHNTLDVESLRRLDGLRGANLRRIFGVNLDVRLMSEDVSLETDKATVTLWGDVDGLGDWEGFDGQYAVMHIDDGVPDIYSANDVRAARASDENSFFFHAGDRIQDISIVRERVRKDVTGEAEWVYTTDSAVVFDLSGGVLAISKTVLDAEMLAITIADSWEQLTIPPAGAFWFHWNEIGTEFSRSSELISLDDLIEGSGT